MWTGVLAIVATAIFVIPAFADSDEATISLGREPEPPFCAENPGGIVDINWNIEHQTTPNYVYYKLEDPTQTIILEEETYPGSTGITVNRQWTVPVGLMDGKYWIRVEYWSFEAGNEANAEVTFYVCNATGTICGEKWEDTDCDGVLTGNDQPVPDWWICLVTPYGDEFCKATDASGIACWEGLPLGTYTVFEPPMAGWNPIYPTSVEVEVTDDQPITVTFFNEQCPTDATITSWGDLKSMYR